MAVELNRKLTPDTPSWWVRTTSPGSSTANIIQAVDAPIRIVIMKNVSCIRDTQLIAVWFDTARSTVSVGEESRSNGSNEAICEAC